MIYRLVFISILGILLGCTQNESLVFNPVHLNSNPCSMCPEVKIGIPEAKGDSKVAFAINTALREEIISLLSFEDSLEVANIQDAIRSFQLGYEQIRKLYADEPAGWKAEIFGEVSYEDEYLVSIKLQTYIFTGGAHGYGSVRYLNFDKHRGAEMEHWQLFRNEPEFQQFAELKFRQDQNIPQGKSINSTGFMFEDDRFYLPENIGLSAEGLTLYYNQYEVASYADGPIEITLPFGEIDEFLSFPKKS
jgi:hypothetical protein